MRLALPLIASLFVIGCSTPEPSLPPAPPAKLPKIPRLSPVTQAKIVGDTRSRSETSGIKIVGAQIFLVGRDDNQLALLRSESSGQWEKTETRSFARGNAEVDAEGLAIDDEHFYVTGSHAVSREGRSYRPARYRVLKMPVESIGRRSITEESLTPLLKGDSNLEPTYRQKLENGGLHIAAIAAGQGRLFFGLRSPASPASEDQSGRVYILEVDESEFFEGKDQHCAHRLHAIDIPWAAHSGIHGLDILPSGDLLVLTGPALRTGNDHPSAAIWKRGSSKLWPLGTLGGLPAGSRPAGIAISQHRPLEFVVVSDGAPEGSPTRYRASKLP